MTDYEETRLFGPTHLAAWGHDMVARLVEEACCKQAGTTASSCSSTPSSFLLFPVDEALSMLQLIDDRYMQRLLSVTDPFELDVLRHFANLRRAGGPGLFLCILIPKIGWSCRFKTFQELRFMSAAFERPSEQAFNEEELLMKSMVEFRSDELGTISTYINHDKSTLISGLRLLDESTGRFLVRTNCRIETSTPCNVAYTICSGSFGGFAAYLLLSSAWKKRETYSKVPPELNLAGGATLVSWWNQLSLDARALVCPWLDCNKTGAELLLEIKSCGLGLPNHLAQRMETARAEHVAEMLVKEEAIEREQLLQGRKAPVSVSTLKQQKRKKKSKNSSGPARNKQAIDSYTLNDAAKLTDYSGREEQLDPKLSSVECDAQTIDGNDNGEVDDEASSVHDDALSSADNMVANVVLSESKNNGNDQSAVPGAASSSLPIAASISSGLSGDHLHPLVGQTVEAETRIRRGSSSDFSFGTLSEGEDTSLTVSSASGVPSPSGDDNLSAVDAGEATWETAQNRKRKKEKRRLLLAAATAAAAEGSHLTAALASPGTVPAKDGFLQMEGKIAESADSSTIEVKREELVVNLPPRLSINSRRTTSISSNKSGSKSPTFRGISRQSPSTVTGLNNSAAPPVLVLAASAAVVDVASNLKNRTRLYSLHNDIQEMAASLELVAARRQPWQLAVAERVKQVVYSIWPRAWCDVFGSIASGLAAPCSDVDMVVRGVPQPDRVRILAHHLERQEWVQMLQAVERTAVPVVKFNTAAIPIAFGNRGNLIAVDITFENEAHHGLNTCGLVRQFVQRWPPLKPLVLVLKQFLVEKGLNDPYVGGISSYGLVLMVAAILKRHWPGGIHSAVVMPPPTSGATDLGSLFVEFLEVYSSRDFVEKGVRFSGEGAKPLGDPCFIEDPLDPNNNVGRSCFGIHQVVEVFAKALEAIRACGRESQIPQSTSILGRVFATSHHIDVVRLVTKVWCPPELPSPGSRVPTEPARQRFFLPPPPVSISSSAGSVATTSSVTAASEGKGNHSVASQNQPQLALERWAAEAREALLKAAKSLELSSAECPMCSHRQGKDHDPAKCEFLILARKCPLL